MIAVEARGLKLTLGRGDSRRQALQNVEVRLKKGRWTSVVGPNGAGKSSLLRVLAGLQPYQAGSVLWNGSELSSLGRRERARLVSWLGQGEPAMPGLAVGDVAMLGRLPHRGWLSAPTQADHDAVERALRSTDSWKLRNRLIGELSGGERQRVMLARTLAVEADVIFMDEPLASLDPPHQASWLRLMRRLVAGGRTVVSVLHEVNAALRADDVVVMESGRAVHHGPVDDDSTHRAISRVFEGCLSVHHVDGRQVALMES